MAKTICYRLFIGGEDQGMGKTPFNNQDYFDLRKTIKKEEENRLLNYDASQLTLKRVSTTFIWNDSLVHSFNAFSFLFMMGFYF